MAATFLRRGGYFDVFHFHFGTSFLPRQIDLGLLRTMGKRIVFHVHGCEVRLQFDLVAHLAQLLDRLLEFLLALLVRPGHLRPPFPLLAQRVPQRSFSRRIVK